MAFIGSWHTLPFLSNMHSLQHALFLSLESRKKNRKWHIPRKFCLEHFWVNRPFNSPYLHQHFLSWGHMEELYLHSTLGRSLQSDVQQRSLLRWISPGSHSSPSSTREFPHTLLFLSLKQVEALAFRLFTIDFLLQFENNYRGAPKQNTYKLITWRCEQWHQAEFTSTKDVLCC